MKFNINLQAIYLLDSIGVSVFYLLEVYILILYLHNSISFSVFQFIQYAHNPIISANIGKCGHFYHTHKGYTPYTPKGYIPKGHILKGCIKSKKCLSTFLAP